MKWRNRFGLSMMIFVLYGYLTYIITDVTDLWKGGMHILFIVGYVLFLLSDGKD